MTDEIPNEARAAIGRLPEWVRRAHSIDIVARKDGREERFQADWLKGLIRALAPRPPAAENPEVPHRFRAAEGDWNLACSLCALSKDAGVHQP